MVVTGAVVAGVELVDAPGVVAVVVDDPGSVEPTVVEPGVSVDEGAPDPGSVVEVDPGSVVDDDGAPVVLVVVDIAIVVTPGP